MLQYKLQKVLGDETDQFRRQRNGFNDEDEKKKVKDGSSEVEAKR